MHGSRRESVVEMGYRESEEYGMVDTPKDIDIDKDESKNSSQ